MSTQATIVDMTPLKRKTLYCWKCQRAECLHEWPAADIKKPPKRCAKCKRLDWDRPTYERGRPPKSGPVVRKPSSGKARRRK